MIAINWSKHLLLQVEITITIKTSSFDNPMCSIYISCVSLQIIKKINHMTPCCPLPSMNK